MVRARPVVTWRTLLAAWLTVAPGSGLAAAQDAPPSRPAAPPVPASAASPATPALPIEQQPYRIRLFLAAEPEARLDGSRVAALLSDWSTLVRRFVGAPWQVEAITDASAGKLVLGSSVERLDPEAVEAASSGADKVWVVRIGGDGAGLVFSGREFDVATRRLGPLQRRQALVIRDASRVFFRFTSELFAPVARIGERFGKDVALSVRGAAIPPADPIGRVVSEGTVFLPLRTVPRKDAPPLVREIRYTYLRVESVEGSQVRCSFLSSFSNPLTERVVQRNTSLWALGVKPGKSPTRLKFQTLPDRAPAGGYVLTVRNLPDGLPRDVGMTDRQGRIRLEPGFADTLVECRLLSGGSEPMISFPLMPGLTPEEQTIPAFDPKPQAVALEARLDAIRDAVVDLVAVRARLEARLKARYDGEDWAGAEDVLKEFRTLPPRDRFADEVARLRDEAAKRQAETRKPILTKTAQARLTELQSLIERYLDDEAFKAYADALEKVKAAPAGKAAKTPAKKGAAPAPKAP